ARLLDLAHLPGAGRDAGEGVGAVRAGHGGRLAGIERAVTVVVDVDRPAGEAGLAGLARIAVAVGVLDLGPRLGGLAPVAEIVVGVRGAGDERLFVETAERVVCGGERARPSGLPDLAHLPGSGRDVHDRVRAGRVGDVGRLA